MNMERFLSEVKAQRNKLWTGIVNRRDHSSMGYTLTYLRREYYVLQGMVYSWLYLSGQWEHAGTVILSTDLNKTIQALLDVDLLRYRAEIGKLSPGNREW